MNNLSERLTLRPGEELTRQKWNALVEALTDQSGRNSFKSAHLDGFGSVSRDKFIPVVKQILVRSSVDIPQYSVFGISNGASPDMQGPIPVSPVRKFTDDPTDAHFGLLLTNSYNKIYADIPCFAQVIGSDPVRVGIDNDEATPNVGDLVGSKDSSYGISGNPTVYNAPALIVHATESIVYGDGTYTSFAWVTTVVTRKPVYARSILTNHSIAVTGSFNFAIGTGLLDNNEITAPDATHLTLPRKGLYRAIASCTFDTASGNTFYAPSIPTAYWSATSNCSLLGSSGTSAQGAIMAVIWNGAGAPIYKSTPCCVAFCEVFSADAGDTYVLQGNVDNVFDGGSIHADGQLIIEWAGLDLDFRAALKFWA